MRTRQIIQESTKLKIVQEVLRGEFTKEQARRIYKIKGKSAILNWMRKYAGIDQRSYGVDPTSQLLKEMMKEPENTQKLKARIKELENELKLSDLKCRAYQIMVEKAKKEYGIELGKKRGAK